MMEGLMADLSRRFLLLTGALSPLLTAPSNAASPAFAADYSLYAGGIRLGDATLAVRGSAARYEAEAALRLSGLARWLFDAEATAWAEGSMADGAPMPARFETEARFDDDLYRIGMRFGPLPEVTANPPLRERPYDAPPQAARGALDPLSAAVALCMPLPERALEGRVVGIYDARRRVDIAIGPVSVEPDRLTATAEIRRVAGFKAKHLARPPVLLGLSWARQGGMALLSRAVADTPFGAAVVTRKS
jgi:hypothetical protein